VLAFYPHGAHVLHFSGGIWQQLNFAANVNADSVVTVPGTNTLSAAGEKANYSSGNGPAVIWSTGSACWPSAGGAEWLCRSRADLSWPCGIRHVGKTPGTSEPKTVESGAS
jgi:hypothetical protein